MTPAAPLAPPTTLRPPPSPHGDDALLDASLRAQAADLVASLSMSLEEQMEVAERERDLRELAARSESVEASHERVIRELVSSLPAMESEPPGPMAWDVGPPTLPPPSDVALPIEPARREAPPVARRSHWRLAAVAVLGAGAAVLGLIARPSTGATPGEARRAEAIASIAASPAPREDLTAAPTLESPAEPIVRPESPSLPAESKTAALMPIRAAATNPRSPVASRARATAPESPPAPATADFAPDQPSLPPFDRAAAARELNGAAARASACRSDDVGTGTLGADVHVTFVPTGRATVAVVTGPLQGTSTGACVAATFHAARVPSFDGEPVTVHKNILIN